MNDWERFMIGLVVLGELESERGKEIKRKKERERCRHKLTDFREIWRKYRSCRSYFISRLLCKLLGDPIRNKVICL